MTFDAVIVGGGPAGLSAALALGRARKRVLLCDAGPRRNAAAIHVQNFVTRDGTPPTEFRRIAREQLAAYPNVEIRDVGVAAIEGERNAFTVSLAAGEHASVTARRILLATGMVDEMLPIDGFRELWGHAIYQCPYCHGWEIQDRRWGFLALDPAHAAMFALLAAGFTKHPLTVFGDLPAEARAPIEAAGLRIETSPVKRLVGRDGILTAVELADGRAVACEALFAQPPQRQTALVESLGLALEDAYLKIDPMTRETSRRGIYASGDLTTRQQSAIIAAASGMQAAAMINAELSSDR